MEWQIQEAKQKFSQLIRQAEQEGPQIVTKHGEEVAVIISSETYRKLKEQKPNFKEFLLNAPDLSQLELERSKETTRDIDF